MSNLRLLRGLRAQLLLWTILPLTVALVVLSLAGVFRHREDMIQLVEQRDRSLASAEATSLAHQIERRAAPLQGAAGASELQGDTAALPSTLEKLVQPLGLMYPAGFALYGTDGHLLATSGLPSARDGSDGGWLQSDAAHALATGVGQARYGIYQVSDGTPGSQLVLMAAPAGSERVLVGALPIDSLRLADVGTHLQTETQGAVFILDENGRPLLSNTAGLPIDPSALVGGRRCSRQAGGHVHAGPPGATSAARPQPY